MRINNYLAMSTGIGRRAADKAIADGRVKINNSLAVLGQIVSGTDKVSLDNIIVSLPEESKQVVMLNKPIGYVCSRDGQGNPTVYDLLPSNLHSLKTIGRLDKDSSGLLLLTNDGQLANRLAHPSNTKVKEYQIELQRALTTKALFDLKSGVMLKDGVSKISLEGGGTKWKVRITEGRNRQIRRTFAKVGAEIVTLHRTNFGSYVLGTLKPGKWINV